jgi:hypothetical protein
MPSTVAIFLEAGSAAANAAQNSHENKYTRGRHAVFMAEKLPLPGGVSSFKRRE